MNLLEGVKENPHLKLYAVLNVSRPMTSNVDDIVEYVVSLGRVDGLINNTHLGEDTTISYQRRCQSNSRSGGNTWLTYYCYQCRRKI
mgnify:CR=1 FL=1